MTYYKATRPDGTDFRTGTVDYGTALTSGAEIRHPIYETVDKRRRDFSPDAYLSAYAYLSVATAPTDCTGMSWPCRLFEVEPIGATWAPGAELPNKRACYSLRMVRELPAHEALGPQGVQLAALIGQTAALTEPQSRELSAAWDAAWDAARYAAWDAARDAAWDAARYAAGAAAWDAAWDAARYAAGDAARYAAGDAARYAARYAAWDAARAAARYAARYAAGALTVRDLIGTRDGWDQSAYDLLTGPWRKVVGPIHPDDADLRVMGATP
jgi:hypothetical protein